MLCVGVYKKVLKSRFSSDEKHFFPLDNSMVILRGVFFNILPFSGFPDFIIFSLSRTYFMPYYLVNILIKEIF